MRSASAHDSSTVGCSTAQRAMPAVSGMAYSISEKFADVLGNGCYWWGEPGLTTMRTMMARRAAAAR